VKSNGMFEKGNEINNTNNDQNQQIHLYNELLNTYVYFFNQIIDVRSNRDIYFYNKYFVFFLD
jgi:hypothetical protein